MLVKLRKLNSEAKLPEKQTSGSAAHDLYALTDVVIDPGVVTIVSTGISLEIPHGYKGEIFSRSGMACKGVWVANQPGKIDSDYRGEIKVLLYNSTEKPFLVSSGDRIAQFELSPVLALGFAEEDTLTETTRGEGGLGSTDRKAWNEYDSWGPAYRRDLKQR